MFHPGVVVFTESPECIKFLASDCCKNGYFGCFISVPRGSRLFISVCDLQLQEHLYCMYISSITDIFLSFTTSPYFLVKLTKPVEYQETS